MRRQWTPRSVAEIVRSREASDRFEDRRERSISSAGRAPAVIEFRETPVARGALHGYGVSGDRGAACSND